MAALAGDVSIAYCSANSAHTGNQTTAGIRINHLADNHNSQDPVMPQQQPLSFSQVHRSLVGLFDGDMHAKRIELAGQRHSEMRTAAWVGRGGRARCCVMPW